MSTSKKVPIWAVFGFFNALFSLLRKIQPDAIAISFDVGRETFRTEMYPQYKAHREAMPDEMRQQMTLIREGVEKLGIPIYELPGYEADDVIGTLSKQAVEEGWRVQILTGDQDAFQLVDDHRVEVLIPPRTPKDEMKVYDREGVYAKMGVYPEQVIDFKGLKGDSSDNIPGVPGVGDKTAARLLADFKTLENLYDHLSDVKGKLREKLATYRDQAFLSKTLATINRESPISATFGDCHLHIPDINAFLAFLDDCEFRNFRKQAPDLLKPFLNGASDHVMAAVSHVTAGETETGEPHESSAGQVAVLEAAAAFFTVPHRVIVEEAELAAFLSEAARTGVLALDLETSGLDVFGDKIVGIALSYHEGPLWSLVERPAVNPLGLKDYPKSFQTLAFEPDAELDPSRIRTAYVPVGHTDGSSQLSRETALSRLRPLLEDSGIVKIVHNAKFEINMFRGEGIDCRGLVMDTMIASYVDRSDRRHGLKSLGYEIFRHPMQEITGLIGTGRKQVPFGEVPVKNAAAYASCDSFVTLELAAHFLRRLENERLTLLYEIELPLTLVLARMEWDGVSLDVPYLQSLSVDLEKRLAVIEADIYRLAGVEFNINSPKQVGEVLFEKLGIPPLRKTKSKSGYSTDAKVLEQLAGEHDVVQRILDYRQLFKLKSTYIDSLPTLLNAKTGRIHSSFNQTVAATGRLSSSDPNLQNIPIRTEEGRLIRKAFVPRDESWSLLSADYSQIELRLLAHYSEDPSLIRAFQAGEDIHTATAALVFGMDPKNVTREQRYQAKAVNFGVIYGQTAHGLSQQLRIPRGEAAEFIDRYFMRYPNVKRIIESVQAEARKTGQVTTLCGRVRDLSEGLNSSVRSVREFSERAAFNTVLQGSAADLMKIAMIRVLRQLDARKLESRMILQVHDELVLEVGKHELDEVQILVREAMELDQPLKVPLVVDMNVGRNWMEG